MSISKLTPKIALAIVEEIFEIKGGQAVADLLGVTAGRISQIRGTSSLTKTNLRILLLGAKKAGEQSGISKANGVLLKHLHSYSSTKTQTKLAKELDVTQPQIAHWNQGSSIPIKRIEKMFKVAEKNASVKINPIYEMKPELDFSSSN